jgi:hypothetical protein
MHGFASPTSTHPIWRRRSLALRRTGCACAVAASALVASTPTAAARPEHGSPRASTAAAGGTVYGGVTPQEFPVAIETSANGRKVIRATIGLRLTCTSGGIFSLPDGYQALAVSKQRKFSAAFGPVTNRNDDGTTTDYQGSLSGAFNKARTKASGKWSLKVTEHDTAGAVTDICDTGNVSWNAKQ